jgi:DNA-binding transcriptional regulator/RsmH inhibitor MraZ
MIPNPYSGALGSWRKTTLITLLFSLFFTAFSTTAVSAQCEADAGTLSGAQICTSTDQTVIQATPNGDAVVPDGFLTLYVLTSGDGLVIENVSPQPAFEVADSGSYTIHTLVFDPSTLDLGIVEFGTTTGVDVNGLLQQGGGDICAALDVAGAKFSFENCAEVCGAFAGTLALTTDDCLPDTVRDIAAEHVAAPIVPEGFSVIYVLTSGEELTIQNVNATPEFTVDTTGRFTIHTLVYDTATLDLGIVDIGVTTGVDVLNLIADSGICADLDAAGAPVNIGECPCEATAGTLVADSIAACLDTTLTLVAVEGDAPNVPDGYSVLYVLTSGEELTIQAVNATPEFTVDTTGRFTIHTLVFDPATLDLGVVEIGVTTGVEVLNLIADSGICAALDAAGAPFDVEACPQVCEADAGRLEAANDPCLEDGMATLQASETTAPTVPEGYSVLYVLTSGEDLTIQGVSATPEFMVDTTGRFTIHTLVYDTSTLDLSIVEIGATTGVDVVNLIAGEGICADLDVTGAQFNVEECSTVVCEATAGTLTAEDACLEGGSATLVAVEGDAPNVPAGYSVIYVLTSGEGLVIEAVNATPEFTVDTTGLFTIHTLVYDSTLDLGIVDFGVTTGVDVNGLLVQGGGDICAALDVAGAQFNVAECSTVVCEATAGTLTAEDACLEGGSATLVAVEGDAPNVPAGYSVIYVLTSGEGLVIEAVNATPEFTVDTTGLFTIHTLVYDSTLDLGIVDFGVTTGVDVNGLLVQGGGDICAALDVAGAQFNVEECSTVVCEATAGTLTAEDACLEGGSATLVAVEGDAPNVPAGYSVIYVLTSGEGLVIEAVNATPEFTVDTTGLFTIHTLVYDSTLDLGIVDFGVTTGVDVNGLLVQGGGDICAALDVAGAQFNVAECSTGDVCEADAGTLKATNVSCFENQFATFRARNDVQPVVPEGYQVLYVLTKGRHLTIQQVSAEPFFTIRETGLHTLHTLVYDPNTLDLSIVEFGKTTGFDVNSLLIQGGGDICASLDVTGVFAHIDYCFCRAEAGTLEVKSEGCIDNGIAATIEAQEVERPYLPSPYYALRYVLTSGDDLIIEGLSAEPKFEVTKAGKYRIHAFVYNYNDLDLSVVQFGKTSAVTVLGLIAQGGGGACGSLDVAGAVFNVSACRSDLQTPTMYPNPAQQRINIVIPANLDDKDMNIEILDAAGNLMLTRKAEAGTRQMEINVADWVNGMYVIRFNYGQGQIKKMRFTKF